MPAATWHHGLVARWWAEFNQGGDDVEYFRSAIEHFGEPALDAGCGTGRILIPLREQGVDIDGSDAAPDMLALCQSALEEKRLSTTLYPQAMHELAPERTYRTVIICGAFGIGGSRAQDLAGLKRVRASLRDGGTLVMDHYLPNFSARSWATWVDQPELPTPYPAGEDRRTAADGTQLEMNTRTLEFDPLNQVTKREIRVRHYEGEQLKNEETYAITLNIYLKSEIALMLEYAGFSNIRVTGNLESRPAEPWRDARIVFTASTAS